MSENIDEIFVTDSAKADKLRRTISELRRGPSHPEFIEVEGTEYVLFPLLVKKPKGSAVTIQLYSGPDMILHACGAVSFVGMGHWDCSEVLSGRGERRAMSQRKPKQSVGEQIEKARQDLKECGIPVDEEALKKLADQLLAAEKNGTSHYFDIGFFQNCKVFCPFDWGVFDKNCPLLISFDAKGEEATECPPLDMIIVAQKLSGEEAENWDRL